MPCLGPTDEDHIAMVRRDGGAGLIASETPAALCAIMTVIERRGWLSGVLMTVDWEEAGIRKNDLVAWWEEHKARDQDRRAKEAEVEVKERSELARLKAKYETTP